MGGPFCQVSSILNDDNNDDYDEAEENFQDVQAKLQWATRSGDFSEN